MRVLLADERAKVRSAVRLLLEEQTDMDVLGEAMDATGLLDWISATCPDVVLLDWELPGAEPANLVSDIRSGCSGVRVVALSGLPEARHQALRAGADGFVSKGDPPERLLQAIRGCGLTARLEGAQDADGPEVLGLARGEAEGLFIG